MSVELVVIAPALVLLLLLVAAGGRWVESHGAIDGAARDAARAASVARTAGNAVSLAQQSADADLATSGWCDGGTVTAGVTGFPPDGVVVVPGDAVTVTVSCNVDMSPFTALGFSAVSPVTGSAVAPLRPLHVPGGELLSLLARARPGRARDRDRGSMAVFTVVFAMAVIFLTALIVDGGNAMNARERAPPTSPGRRPAPRPGTSRRPPSARDGPRRGLSHRLDDRVPATRSRSCSATVPG